MNVNNSLLRRLTQWRGQFKKYTKSKFFREGLPFILFIVIGSFGLREICTIRYDFKNVQTVKVPIEEEEYLKMLKHEQDLLQSYKKIDYENWENNRIPRESDEGKTFS